MSYRYCLTVADVKILLEADQPLVENEAFLPFLTNYVVPDVHAVIRKADPMPQLPKETVYEDIFCKVTRNKAGHLQKFFFNSAGGQYIVACYDPDGKHVLIQYPSAYGSGVLDLQNCFYCLGFEEYLLQHNKLSIHAACIDSPSGGILFSGVSGIGKSTQADLWCKYRGARLINGDRPILSKEGKLWSAWGSPYAGSSKVYVNDSSSVTAIILLKQASTCTLRKLSLSEAFRGVWSGLTVRSWDAAFVEKASALTEELVTAVPIYEFSCTPDKEAVIFLEEELRKENYL